MQLMNHQNQSGEAGTSMSGSYSYDDVDETGRREREKAQREFDARLERERQGQDFDSAENKKW